MAYFEKRGNGYRAQIRRQGMPNMSKTFRRLTDARAWATSIEDGINKGTAVDTRAAEKRTVATLVDTVIDDILPHMERNKDSKKTGRLLEWWKDHCGQYSLANFSSSVINDHKRQLRRTRSPATVNRYLAALGMAMKQAHRELHWINTNPMKAVSRYKEPKGREKALEVEELRTILDTCKESRQPALHPIVAIAASTGARSTEIRSLRWPQVNLKKAEMYLEDTKNDDRRTLYLFGEALEALTAWRKAHRFSKGYVFPGTKKDSYIDCREAWKAAAIKAGFPGLRFHDLRHVAAAFLDEAGCTPAQIARVLGHRSLAMVSRYTFVRDKVAKDATDKLREVLGDG